MDDVVQDETAREQEEDLEAIQAHMEMTMALAYESIEASMKNSTLSDEYSYLHQSLADYRPRPPRLGVGAIRTTASTTNSTFSNNEGTSLARETARLHGRLAGKKRRRDEEEDEGEKAARKKGEGKTGHNRRDGSSSSSDEGESRAGTISKTPNAGSGIVDRFALPGTSKKKKKKKLKQEEVEVEKEKEKGSREATVKKEEKPMTDEQEIQLVTGLADTVPKPLSPDSTKTKKDKKKKGKKKEEKMEDAKPLEEGRKGSSLVDAPQTEATKEQSQQSLYHGVYGVPSSTSSETVEDKDGGTEEQTPKGISVTDPTNEIKIESPSSSRTTKGPPSPLQSRFAPNEGVTRLSGLVSPLANRFKFGSYPPPTASLSSSPPTRQKESDLRSGSVRSRSSESKRLMMTQREWKRLQLKREVLAARTWTVPVARSKVEEEQEEEEEEGEEDEKMNGPKSKGTLTGDVFTAIQPSTKGTTTRTTLITTSVLVDKPVLRLGPQPELDVPPPPAVPRVGDDDDDLSTGDHQGEKDEEKKEKKQRKKKQKKKKKHRKHKGDEAGDESPLSRDVDQGDDKGGKGDSDQE